MFIFHLIFLLGLSSSDTHWPPVFLAAAGTRQLLKNLLTKATCLMHWFIVLNLLKSKTGGSLVAKHTILFWALISILTSTSSCWGTSGNGVPSLSHWGPSNHSRFWYRSLPLTPGEPRFAGLRVPGTYFHWDGVC